ncbi:monocarboxylate transporter 9-like isoform X3 [Mercenaria mercenaria]|uniref:monocarboxylate transporter 9-like isoform X3 n=1 Tax=Mercenaria mercenaria TaxID=6596 RepID=UPI00234EE51D|nr:monocarboxylate transporter 9-like isoform X3 [Mercenaria mercenaria]
MGYGKSENSGRNMFSDLDRGWSWMILFASFSSFFLLGGLINSVGVIHSVLLEKYKESVSLTAWVGSLHSALLLFGAPVSSIVTDRFSCRVAIVLSGIFFIIGYLGTAFATNVRVAILTCGIIGGIGAGLGCNASLVVIGFNFDKRRDLALGLFYGCCYVVSAGVHVNFVGINYISSAVGLQFFCGGAGGIIGPVFAGVLVDQGGTYNQSIIVAACCLLISSILGAVLLCIPKPAIIKDAPSDKCKTDGDECETTFDLNDDDNKRL